MALPHLSASAFYRRRELRCMVDSGLGDVGRVAKASLGLEVKHGNYWLRYVCLPLTHFLSDIPPQAERCCAGQKAARTLRTTAETMPRPTRGNRAGRVRGRDMADDLSLGNEEGNLERRCVRFPLYTSQDLNSSPGPARQNLLVLKSRSYCLHSSIWPYGLATASHALAGPIFVHAASSTAVPVQRLHA